MVLDGILREEGEKGKLWLIDHVFGSIAFVYV